jgi:hypothetical protein
MVPTKERVVFPTSPTLWVTLNSLSTSVNVILVVYPVSPG